MRWEVEWICDSCGSCGIADSSVSVDELHNHRLFVDAIKAKPIEMRVWSLESGTEGHVQRYLERPR